MSAFEVRFTRSAIRDLASSKTPRRVVDAALALAEGQLSDEPWRSGRPLEEPYDGLWSHHRGDFRVIYAWSDHSHVVSVVAVRHRSDAYRPGTTI